MMNESEMSPFLSGYRRGLLVGFGLGPGTERGSAFFAGYRRGLLGLPMYESDEGLDRDGLIEKYCQPDIRNPYKFEDVEK